MKQLFALCAIIAFGLLACTKTNTITNTLTITDTLKVTLHDTSVVTVKDSLESNFDFITAHTWMYNSYYIGYVDSNHLGTLQYQRGASGNLIDLDNARTTYNADGTITELDQNGGSTPGTWHFGNDQQTYIDQLNATGTYDGPILRLDSSHYYWSYLAIDGTVRYGEYIPAQ